MALTEDEDAEDMLMAKIYFTQNKTDSRSPSKSCGLKQHQTVNNPEINLPTAPLNTATDIIREKGARTIRNANVFEISSPQHPPYSDEDTYSELDSMEESYSDISQSDVESYSNSTASAKSDDDDYGLGLGIEGDEETNRYFGKRRVNPAKCYNCGALGHIARDCAADSSDLICSLCNFRGHTRNDCPNQVCFNCNMLGHQSRSCPEPRNRPNADNSICGLCDNPGHTSKTCSTATWRKYIYNRAHSVPSVDARLRSSELDRIFRSLNLYCFCCAKKGHFGDECQKFNSRLSKDHWSSFHQYSDIYLKNCLFEKTRFYKSAENRSSQRPFRSKSRMAY